MASPVDDRGVDAFLVLLSEGAKGPRPKSEALEAVALRPVWLATWEPRAEGFRTLIDADGEEALAVFSCEEKLKSAAARFNWLEPDGTIATHRAIGGDILRHAWTREYAHVVIDVGSDASLEYERDELKSIMREMDSTGPFRTSRPPPPPPPKKAAPQTPFPVPVDRISTMYSMAPSHSEKLDRLSDLPTKPHEIPYDSEPPTKPRRDRRSKSFAGTLRSSARAERMERLASSRPLRFPRKTPPASQSRLIPCPRRRPDSLPMRRRRRLLMQCPRCNPGS
ncbi:MAG: SseB family protein [Deltaproteobacteria bacterium]|nr:SseB family protein [Deltaproteobacteria bacterium]